MSWRAPARHAGMDARGAIRVKGIGLARYPSDTRRNKDGTFSRLNLKLSLQILEELGVEPFDGARVILLFGDKGTKQEGLAAIKIATEKEILYQTTWKIMWRKGRPSTTPTMYFPISLAESNYVFPAWMGKGSLRYQTLDYDIQGNMVIWKLPTKP